MTRLGRTDNARRRPLGIYAMTLFFAFGTGMSALAASLLLFPGSQFDRLWGINPQARTGFVAIGIWAVILMLAVSTACATATIGLWRQEVWGLRAAIAILAVNLVGDTVNVVVRHDWRTLIGLPVGGVMIAYLVTNRAAFGRGKVVASRN